MIYKVFFAHVLMRPEAIAVVTSEGDSYTYHSANERVNQWALYLLSCGVTAGDRVGVLLNNEDHHVFIYLALDRINACYVPFDTDIPKKQLLLDLNVLKVARFLIEDSLRENYKFDPTLEVLLYDRNLPALDAIDRERLHQTSYEDEGSDKISYCVSSSGTTGDKKWIPISGVGLIYWANVLTKVLSLTASNRMLVTRSPAYDARIFEYVCAFSGGSSLHLLDKLARKNLPSILTACEKASINCIILIASQLGVENAEEVIFALKRSGLNHLMVTGDTCTPYLKGLCERYDINLYNAYGPTESTFGLSLLRVNELALNYNHDVPIVPIGKPYGEDVRYHLLDGNLYIESPYLTPGYLNPAENDSSFQVQSKPEGRRVRMFNTGDAFSESNGFLFFHGRTTLHGHIKINGVKIMPVFIEQCIRDYNNEQPQSIAQVAVVIKRYLNKDKPFAYIVTTNIFNIDNFLSYLKGRLKREEIPLLVCLDELPKQLTSGKIDLQSLMKLEDKMEDFSLQHEEDKVRSPQHSAVKNICQKIAKIESIPDDFELMFCLDSMDLLEVFKCIKNDVAPTYDYSSITQLKKLSIHTIAMSITEKNMVVDGGALIYPLATRAHQNANIFFLPALLGEGRFSYRYLSERMAQLHDKHIYGLSDPGIFDSTMCPPSFEFAAMRYISAIKTIQPEGPYELLGFSFGSTLAYEVAKQLHAQGEVVSQLHLVDGFPPVLYQQVSVSAYVQLLNTMIQSIISILNDKFYNEKIKAIDLTWDLNSNKENQLEYGFNQLEKELQNKASLNVLRMAKCHLSLMLKAPLSDKKLFLDASFYQTNGAQDYIHLMKQIPELSQVSSDYYYYFWSRYCSNITRSRVKINCEHLDLLTETGARHLQKLSLLIGDDIIQPFYQLQQVDQTKHRLTLFFINRREYVVYFNELVRNSFVPVVFFYDQHFKNHKEADMTYASKASITCDVPCDKVGFVKNFVMAYGIFSNMNPTGIVQSQPVVRRPDQGCANLMVFVNDSPLLTLTFKYHSLISAITAALRTPLVNVIKGTNITYYHNFRSGHHTIAMISSFLADFITILSAHMDPASDLCAVERCFLS